MPDRNARLHQPADTPDCDIDCWEDFEYASPDVTCRHGLTRKQADRKVRVTVCLQRLRLAVDDVNDAHARLRRALAEED